MGVQTQTSIIEQILNNARDASFSPEDFYSSLTLAYQNIDKAPSQRSTVINAQKKLTEDQNTAIINLAAYFKNQEFQIYISGEATYKSKYHQRRL